MTIRQKLLNETPVPRGLLSPEFDVALVGWVQRADLPATAAYLCADILPVAIPLWGEEETVVYMHRQISAESPEVVLLDALPTPSSFWQQVKDGMLVWDHVADTAITHVAYLRGALCAVYHADAMFGALVSGIDESDNEDVSPAVLEFFEKNILNARLGPRTPMLLSGAPAPGHTNGLGLRKS
jgi:hypothetical protein